MNLLKMIFKGPAFLTGKALGRIFRIELLYKIFLIIALIPGCSRDDVLQKVKEYNTASLYFIAVLSVSPAEGTADADTGSLISVQFDKDIDMSTVDASTFIINGGSVTGVYSYDSVSKTVTFTPSPKLSYSTAYTVNLTQGILSTAGDCLSSDYIWSFTTEAQHFITVTSVMPASGAVNVLKGSVISAQFSDDIDMSTVNSSTFAVNGGAVSGTFSYDALLRIVTFTPSSNLSYSTAYTIKLTQGILSTAGDYLSSDYIWLFMTEMQHFIDVVSEAPADGAADVGAGSVISVQFTDEINMATVTSSTFTVNDVTTPASPVPVTGIYSYNSSMKTVTFTPDANFKYNTPYSVTLTTGIKSTAGDYLLSDYTFSFTTEAQYFISVISVSPLNGTGTAPVGSVITARFSDDILFSTVGPASFFVSGGVTGTYTYDSLIKTVKFTPDANLLYSTSYTVTLTTGIQSTAGDYMSSNYTWSFTTVPQHFVTVDSVSPAESAVDVYEGTAISVKFSDDINMSTVTSSTFTVNNITVPASPVPVTGAFSYDSPSKTVTFTPDVHLSYSTPYEVKLTTGIESTAGDSMASGKTWSFTTIAQHFVTVLSVFPLNGTADADEMSNISVTFSDDINMSTVNSLTFAVNDVTIPATPVAVSGTFSYDSPTKTVTFTPDLYLSYDTPYKVDLTTGIENTTGDTMESNYSWSFATAAQYFINAVSVSPSSGASGVSVGTSISVAFTDDIDMTTVNSSTFIITPNPGTGIYSYDPLLRTVTFTPDTSLSYSTLYAINLTTDIKSTSGDYMASAYTWSFTTATQFFINVVSVIPGNSSSNIPAGTDIDVTFDDNIDISTVNPSTFTLTPGPVTGVYSYDSVNKTVVFNPDTDLSPLTLYTVNLTTGIKNTAGDGMAADYSWSFTTAPAAQPGIYILSPLNTDFISGKTYNFGNLLNPAIRTAHFTAGNSGSATLNITNVTVSDVNFSTSLTPGSIGINSSIVFSIIFQPDAITGTKNAVMTISNNDPLRPSFVIKLTGEAVATPEPEIQITKGGVILVNTISTADLGTTLSGVPVSIPLVMYNIGSSDLVISNVTFGGTNPGLFSTDFGSVPVTIPVDATKMFNITFSSSSAINAKADITFQNNDSDESSFKIKLKGRVR